MSVDYEGSIEVVQWKLPGDELVLPMQPPVDSGADETYEQPAGAHAAAYRPEHDELAVEVEDGPAHAYSELDDLVGKLLVPAAEIQEGAATREDIVAQMLILRGLSQEVKARVSRAKEEFDASVPELRNLVRETIYAGDLSPQQQRKLVRRWLDVFEASSDTARNLREYDALAAGPATLLLRKAPASSRRTRADFRFRENEQYETREAPKLIWDGIDGLSVTQEVYRVRNSEQVSEEEAETPLLIEVPLTQMADHIALTPEGVQGHVEFMLQPDRKRHVDMVDILKVRDFAEMLPSDPDTDVATEIDAAIERYFEYWLGSEDDKQRRLNARDKYGYGGRSTEVAVERMAEDLQQAMAVPALESIVTRIEEAMLVKFSEDPESRGTTAQLAAIFLLANEASNDSDICFDKEVVQWATQVLYVKFLARGAAANTQQSELPE